METYICKACGKQIENPKIKIASWVRSADPNVEVLAIDCPHCGQSNYIERPKAD
jgi:DNA-directed RNA polymerase subunit RPC12/RpoP